jgi:hypothetical protein
VLAAPERVVIPCCTRPHARRHVRRRPGPAGTRLRLVVCRDECASGRHRGRGGVGRGCWTDGRTGAPRPMPPLSDVHSTRVLSHSPASEWSVPQAE